jgi:XrtN system VIT domain protein
MEKFSAHWKDKVYIAGLLLVLVSLLFFSLPWQVPSSEADTFGLFIPCFLCAISYFVFLWVCGRLRKPANGGSTLFVWLVLCLLSCYSLNRAVVVFNDSVPWFASLLVLLCINYLSLHFFAFFPKWLQHVSFFTMGISIAVFLYLSSYLFPLYGIGAAAFFFFGISLHVFIPLLFLIFSIRFLITQGSRNKTLLWSAAVGLTTALLVVVVFAVQWGSTVRTINRAYRQATVAENDGLPAWVSVAQKIAPGPIAEKALKTEIVYAVPRDMERFSFWNVPTLNFGEAKLHDPLIVIGSLFGGLPNLDIDARVKILESRYDSRHQAQERFWRGNDLETEQVNTNIDIWPQFGLSYTEKIVTVSNMAFKRGSFRNDRQEAIYTFHLPEGAVVTALSLWIEGIETKGVLTTRAKAANAYNTIVGRENRDPSVVHWQEGNTVSVRVFPVVAGESRQFKLGITAPLKRSAENAGMYENIYFDGPDYNNARENVTIHFNDDPKDFVIPASFEARGKNAYSVDRRYQSRWDLKVTDKPLSTNAFSFDGKMYSMHPYKQKNSLVDVRNLYLDINRAWTWHEFNSIYKRAAGKNIFVYNGSMVKLNESNKDELFYGLQQQPFSLFPIFYITDRTHSLLITKNAGLSPDIGDLKDSRFLGKLKASLANSPEKILLYDLGEELSPYLKTLKEYRVFRYEKGNLRELPLAVNEVPFAGNIETDNEIVIESAGLTIQQSDGAMSSSAPDHLMRLFSYNHIMQKMGTRLLTDTTLDEDLVGEAAKACVVWWYDNGSLRTIDQMTWRWAALKGGKNFSLVNVTAESREILDKEIEDIVYGNRLQKLLN